MAYAVGLLTTDGCLSKDGRHIDFTSKDKDLIETFKDCLGLTNKIGKKTSGYTNKKSSFRVQFGDINFYKWLLKIGLTPHKSKSVGVLKIPDKVFFDFLRGCFDGDGTIFSYWDPRWHSSYMFYIQFVSASPPHLQWLEKTINRLAGVSGKINESKRAYQLVFAKKSSYILFRKMFYIEDIPFLERKHRKAITIFKTDELHNHARVV